MTGLSSGRLPDQHLLVTQAVRAAFACTVNPQDPQDNLEATKRSSKMFSVQSN